MAAGHCSPGSIPWKSCQGKVPAHRITAAPAAVAAADTAGDQPPLPAPTAATIPPLAADLPAASIRAETDQVGLEGNPAVPAAPDLPSLPVALPVNKSRRQRRAPLPPLSAAWRRLAATAAATIDYHLAAAAADADSGLAAATAAAAAAAKDVDRLGGTVSCAQALRIADQENFLGSSGGGGGGAGGRRQRGGGRHFSQCSRLADGRDSPHAVAEGGVLVGGAGAPRIRPPWPSPPWRRQWMPEGCATPARRVRRDGCEHQRWRKRKHRPPTPAPPSHGRGRPLWRRWRRLACRRQSLPPPPCH